MKSLRLIIITMLISCNNNEPRYPLNYTKDDNSTLISQIITDQNKKIDDYISKNLENNYLNSKKGFFYFFQKTNDLTSKKAEFGDIIIGRGELVVIRGGWNDRYGSSYEVGIVPGKPSALNISIKGIVPVTYLSELGAETKAQLIAANK